MLNTVHRPREAEEAPRRECRPLLHDQSAASRRLDHGNEWCFPFHFSSFSPSSPVPLHADHTPIQSTGFCGFMSILSSLRYALGPPDDHTHIYIALALIPAGLFFDFMDGKVARWRKKSSLMGQELDSLADLVGAPPLLLCSRVTCPPAGSPSFPRSPPRINRNYIDTHNP